MPINSFLYPGAKVTTGYEVANSCRFNDGDSAYMHKTPGSAGSRTTWTLSMWVKRGALGADMPLAGTGSGANQDKITFASQDTISWYTYQSSSYVANQVTTQVFRDVSAWYHFVFVWDSTNGTAGNRQRIYVNGSEITSFGTDTQPSSSAVTMWNNNQQLDIGRMGSAYFDGYIAEVCFIDGQALTPTSFGEFDSDSPTIWKPKDVSGLTFGTNGFYLDFEDSSNLGNDANGGTDFTEANLAATDQATDTPTNNFCTWNPLDNYYANSTFSEGNLQLASGGSGDETYNTSTFGLTAGKWYCELKHTGGSSTPYRQLFGIAQKPTDDDGQQLGGDNDDSWGYYDNDGNIRHNNSDVIGYNTWTQNDIIGLALDLDNNRLYFSKNGTWQNSSNPEDGTNPISIDSGFTYFIAWGDATTHSNYCQVNFGNPVHSISSGNSDANGYGNFEYAVPSGYLAICTKNLGSDGG